MELKPTQLWPPQKSTFCDRSVWFRHGGKVPSASDGKSLGWKQRGLQHCTLPKQCRCRRERCIVYWEDTEKTPVMWRADHVQGEGAQPLLQLVLSMKMHITPILRIGFRHQNWQCDKVGVLWVFCKIGKKCTSLVCYGCFPKYPIPGSRNSHFLYRWHCNAGNQAESEH